jgi:hypothetical protein
MNTVIELLRSSALVQGVLALALTGAIIYQVLAGQAVSEVLLTLDATVVGYYFGTKSQQAIDASVLRHAHRKEISDGS